MKLILEKNIDVLLMNKIEYLNYLKTSYEYILENILKEKSKYKFNKDLLDYYMSEYTKNNIEFTLFSNEIIKNINEKYLNNKKYYSEYSFNDNVIRIYEYEKGENLNERKKMDSISRPNCKNGGK